MKNQTLKTITEQLTTMLSMDTNSLASPTADKKVTMKRVKLVQRALEALLEIQRIESKDD